MAELRYEEALKRLAKLVDELETPDVGLEARLRKFEEGTKLARVLLKKLEQAKKKVEILVSTNIGAPTVVPADEDEFETETPSADSGRPA